MMYKLPSMGKCGIFSLAALSLISLFFSSSSWLPSIFSYWKLSHLSYFEASFFNPRYLFILCNIIITLLIGESKINSGRKCTPSPAAITKIYEEYLERSDQDQVKILENQKKLEKAVEQERDLNEVDMVSKKIEIVDEENEKGEDMNEKMNLEAEDHDNEEDEDEDCNLPDHEELRKRVEDFIARINQQRKLEARMLVSCCA